MKICTYLIEKMPDKNFFYHIKNRKQFVIKSFECLEFGVILLKGVNLNFLAWI